MWSSSSKLDWLVAKPCWFVRQIRLLHSVVPPWKNIITMRKLFLFIVPYRVIWSCRPIRLTAEFNLTSQGSIDTNAALGHAYLSNPMQIRNEVFRAPPCLSLHRSAIVICSIVCLFLVFAFLPCSALPCPGYFPRTLTEMSSWFLKHRFYS